MQGPDGAIVEYQGNMPAERFNHVHMYQEDPLCAVLWYQKHLNARANGRGPLPTEVQLQSRTQRAAVGRRSKQKGPAGSPRAASLLTMSPCSGTQGKATLRS